MAGENVDKIKFSVNGKDITLREGERLGNDKRKLKDLGSLWDKITQDNKLDKNELDMFKKLDQILNKNGEWNSVQMQSIAKEFEASGKEIGDFLDFKLKETAKVYELHCVEDFLALPMEDEAKLIPDFEALEGCAARQGKGKTNRARK